MGVVFGDRGPGNAVSAGQGRSSAASPGGDGLGKGPLGADSQVRSRGAEGLASLPQKPERKTGKMPE